jgi:hypothetical protein
MTEEIFAIDSSPTMPQEQVTMRDQEQTDTWAVHQLYHAAVPSQVQFAEAWTSHQWEVDKPKHQRQWWRSFVLEDGRQIVAYAMVRVGARVASIELMYLPDCRRQLGSFCRGVVNAAMAQGGANRVFISARAYQAELMSLLEDAGFTSVRRQDLLIKYTTAKVVAKPAENIILAPSDVRERAPKRVPTFLNRRPRQKVSA